MPDVVLALKFAVIVELENEVRVPVHVPNGQVHEQGSGVGVGNGQGDEQGSGVGFGNGHAQEGGYDRLCWKGHEHAGGYVGYS